MVEPEVGDAEDFATEIIDKVTVDAMDIVDEKNASAGENNARLASNLANAACESCSEPRQKNRLLRSMPHQNADRTTKKSCCCAEEYSRDENKIPKDVSERTSEEIRKIVEGLQGIQIGDSSLVKPVIRVPSLERQIKRAVTDIQNGACEIFVTEVPIIEGQGDEALPRNIEDVENEIEHVEYEIEELDEPPQKISKLEEQRTTCDLRFSRQAEVSKLRSSCFLHRMIKELEDAEANRDSVLAGGSVSVISQERIAAWEENEERFIRTIEESKDENEEKIDEDRRIEEFFAPLPVEPPIECIVDVEIEEIKSNASSTPRLLPPPLPPPESETPEVIAIIEDSEKPEVIARIENSEKPEVIASVEEFEKPEASAGNSGKPLDRARKPLEPDRTLERSKTKSHKSLGQKIRRFFQTAFKRAKD